MQLVQVKDADIQKLCPLDGVKIAEVRQNSYAAMSITLVDGAGHTLVVQGSDYSGCVRVFVKAPPQKVKKFRLLGELFTGIVGLEVNIDETFDARDEAVTRKNALEQHGGSFKIEETEVEVAEE